MDKSETTDKGYINQAAILSHRADSVEKLYAEPPPEGVIVIDNFKANLSTINENKGKI